MKENKQNNKYIDIFFRKKLCKYKKIYVEKT